MGADLTTIAVCKGWIAADTRAVLDERVATAPKLYQRKGMAFAGAGDCDSIELVWQWLKAGARVNRRPTLKADTFEGLVIRDGQIDYIDESLIPMKIMPPFALGSGSKFALAFLSLGHSAPEAVQMVIDKQLDIYTGGEVQKIQRGGSKRRKR